jgi:polyisoprenoid-binding protein YceI
MRLVKIILLSASVALFATNCTQAPKSDKAETGDAKKVDEKKSADATEFAVDTKNSEVAWVGTKPVGKHNGTFKLKEGKVSVKDGNVVGGTFVIDINSLEVKDLKKETGKEKLEGHLKDKDFFESSKFPTATFEIVSVKGYKKSDKAKKGDDKDKEYTLADPTHLVEGNLELKGVKKSVIFPAKITVSEDGVKTEAKFNIERTDWGLVYGNDKGLGDKFIRPTVHIGLNISAKK